MDRDHRTTSLLTLVILAAGLSRRYGSLKQIEPVGPNDEIIMDYGIYDALHAGFKKIIFVLSPALAPIFKKNIARHIAKSVDVDQVIQSAQAIRNRSFAHRQKPWGTGHAILCCKTLIDGPFAVINADDFYGREAYQQVAAFLLQPKQELQTYCLIAYRLQSTLSPSGPVSRALCKINAQCQLTILKEHTHIQKKEDGIYSQTSSNPITPSALVSTNCWGFFPSLFRHLEPLFNNFIDRYSQDLETEFFLPDAIQRLIQKQQIQINVQESLGNWMGMTYRDDSKRMKIHIQELIAEGIYPSPLYSLASK